MSRTASDRSTVAIVIPALNEERSISACLDAVLAQTWTDLDVIVADGGSTDATRAIVDEYGGRDRPNGDGDGDRSGEEGIEGGAGEDGGG